MTGRESSHPLSVMAVPVIAGAWTPTVARRLMVGVSVQCCFNLIINNEPREESKLLYCTVQTSVFKFGSFSVLMVFCLF